MFNFSIPMPYNTEIIDNIYLFNKEIRKSKITSFYFSLPSTCEFYTGFEQPRNTFFDKKDFIFWEKLIFNSLEKNIDVIYCLNSPKNLEIENSKFSFQIENLNNLLDRFKKIGINKLRVANPKLMTYLSMYYPEFELYASTSFEFKTIKEYQNFIILHPTVKQIVPSHDINKNFKLLKNLKKQYPNIDIEIIVNEGCISGCPHRYAHSVEYIGEYTQDKIIGCLKNNYFNIMCHSYMSKNLILHICKGNQIFPWEIDSYSNIGITNFKLVGRDILNLNPNMFIRHIKKYIEGVESIKYIKKYPISLFTRHTLNNDNLKNYSVEKIIKYLPKINHFEQHGHLCNSICGIECKYCYECTKKIIKGIK